MGELGEYVIRPLLNELTEIYSAMEDGGLGICGLLNYQTPAPGDDQARASVVIMGHPVEGINLWPWGWLLLVVTYLQPSAIVYPKITFASNL